MPTWATFTASSPTARNQHEKSREQQTLDLQEQQEQHQQQLHSQQPPSQQKKVELQSLALTPPEMQQAGEGQIATDQSIIRLQTSSLQTSQALQPSSPQNSQPLQPSPPQNSQPLQTTSVPLQQQQQPQIRELTDLAQTQTSPTLSNGSVVLDRASTAASAMTTADPATARELMNRLGVGSSQLSRASISPTNNTSPIVEVIAPSNEVEAIASAARSVPQAVDPTLTFSSANQQMQQQMQQRAHQQTPQHIRPHMLYQWQEQQVQQQQQQQQRHLMSVQTPNSIVHDLSDGKPAAAAGSSSGHAQAVQYRHAQLSQPYSQFQMYSAPFSQQQHPQPWVGVFPRKPVPVNNYSVSSATSSSAIVNRPAVGVASAPNMAGVGQRRVSAVSNTAVTVPQTPTVPNPPTPILTPAIGANFSSTDNSGVNSVLSAASSSAIANGPAFGVAAAPNMAGVGQRRVSAVSNTAVTVPQTPTVPNPPTPILTPAIGANFSSTDNSGVIIPPFTPIQPNPAVVDQSQKLWQQLSEEAGKCFQLGWNKQMEAAETSIRPLKEEVERLTAGLSSTNTQLALVTGQLQTALMMISSARSEALQAKEVAEKEFERKAADKEKKRAEEDAQTQLRLNMYITRFSQLSKVLQTVFTEIPIIENDPISQNKAELVLQGVLALKGRYDEQAAKLKKLALESSGSSNLGNIRDSTISLLQSTISKKEEELLQNQQELMQLRGELTQVKNRNDELVAEQQTTQFSYQNEELEAKLKKVQAELESIKRQQTEDQTARLAEQEAAKIANEQVIKAAEQAAAESARKELQEALGEQVVSAMESLTSRVAFDQKLSESQKVKIKELGLEMAAHMKSSLEPGSTVSIFHHWRDAAEMLYAEAKKMINHSKANDNQETNLADVGAERRTQRLAPESVALSTSAQQEEELVKKLENEQEETSAQSPLIITQSRPLTQPAQTSIEPIVSQSNNEATLLQKPIPSLSTSAKVKPESAPQPQMKKKTSGVTPSSSKPTSQSHSHIVKSTSGSPKVTPPKRPLNGSNDVEKRMIRPSSRKPIKKRSRVIQSAEPEDQSDSNPTREDKISAIPDDQKEWITAQAMKLMARQSPKGIHCRCCYISIKAKPDWDGTTIYDQPTLGDGLVTSLEEVVDHLWEKHLQTTLKLRATRQAQGKEPMKP